MVTRHRLWIAVTLLAACGCSGVSVQVETIAEPTSPVGPIRKIVLVPLVNRSDDRGAALALQAALARSLVSEAGVQVLDVPDGVAFNAERFDREQARQLAALAAADAVMTGIVFAYGYVPDPGTPPTPAVRLDVRLISAGAPDLAWAARASAFDSPGMASGGSTLTSMADDVARALARELVSRK